MSTPLIPSDEGISKVKLFIRSAGEKSRKSPSQMSKLIRETIERHDTLSQKWNIEEEERLQFKGLSYILSNQFSLLMIRIIIGVI
jgi:hypothetical protein